MMKDLVLAVIVFLAIVAVILVWDAYGATQPHGMKIEVRRCHPISATAESDESLTCSCTVADWIEDGDRRVLVCEQ
jgi:hypothetical protein